MAESVFLSPKSIAIIGASDKRGSVGATIVITSYSIHYTKLYEQNMSELNYSMNKSEILNSMLSMMSEHRNMMIQNMDQMSKQELLDHAKLMREQFSKMGTKSTGMLTKQDGVKMQGQKSPLYNEMLNPRQVEYPNIFGFV